MYAYFVSVVNITANTDSDYRMFIFDPCTHVISGFRNSEIYGVMFGYAQGLIELIPSICKLGYKRIAEESRGECSFESIALYRSLGSQIQEWQAPPSIYKDEGYACNLDVAAKIYQNAVLIFLHANFYGSNVSEPALLDLVDTSIDSLLPLVKSFSSHSSIASTMLWPCMIIGSCLRHVEQRNVLRALILASPFNMTGVSKAIQILDWLWEDDDICSYGPYGLGAIMKKHKIRPCMG